MLLGVDLLPLLHFSPFSLCLAVLPCYTAWWQPLHCIFIVILSVVYKFAFRLVHHEHVQLF